MSVGLILLSIAVGVQDEAPVEKMDVPSAAGRKEALKVIRDLFKQEYAKRDVESRRELAANLLEQADTTHDSPVTRFVLLEEARGVAASVGDVETAMAAARKTAESFKVAPFETEEAALKAARKSVRRPDQAATLADAYLELARSAIEALAYEPAARAAKEAKSLGRMARDKGLGAEGREGACQESR